MSFQHFRLGEVPLHQPIHQQPPVPQPAVAGASTTKQPYGSGDTDDGYTLIFANMEAFQTWRTGEEERNCVEFVKGDTHGSKADPPRFKDHTKLVCARHSRSGRKKYVKKHPERVRKVPSRKLDGQGCQASISYKTYFDTEEVRACYIAQHSHEIGLANLPFTRRGRKVAVQNEKERGRNKSMPASDQDQMGSASTPGGMGQSSQHGVSSFPLLCRCWHPFLGNRSLPRLPSRMVSQMPYIHSPQIAPPQQQPVAQNMPHERWENMATLFQTVRDHARQFEYPPASVAALETVLIRLYLESPMGVSPHHNMANFIQHTLTMHNRNQAQAAQGSGANGSSTDGQGSSNADGNS